jgi:hypothetical protein
MQVGTFSTPGSGGWRWRIVNYAGETIEESPGVFATIALAMADGRKRLSQLDVDRSAPRTSYRSTNHARGGRRPGYGR